MIETDRIQIGNKRECLRVDKLNLVVRQVDIGKPQIVESILIYTLDCIS